MFVTALMETDNFATPVWFLRDIISSTLQPGPCTVPLAAAAPAFLS